MLISFYTAMLILSSIAIAFSCIAVFWDMYNGRNIIRSLAIVLLSTFWLMYTLNEQKISKTLKEQEREQPAQEVINRCT